MPAAIAKKYRALTDLSLRAKPDVKCEDWLLWKAGEVFTPPAHMKIAKCLERGIIEEVTSG